MNIIDLDEAQGLSVQMLNDWMLANGWVRERQISRSGDWSAKKAGCQRTAFLPADDGDMLMEAVSQLAKAEQMTEQAILQLVNPRMRVGMPSVAAQDAHSVEGWPGYWLCQTPGNLLRVCFFERDQLVIHGLDQNRTIPKVRISEKWSFWPVTVSGKIRWPTDSQGQML